MYEAADTTASATLLRGATEIDGDSEKLLISSNIVQDCLATLYSCLENVRTDRPSWSRLKLDARKEGEKWAEVYLPDA